MGFAAIPTVLPWRQGSRTKLVLGGAVSKFFAVLWIWLRLLGAEVAFVEGWLLVDGC